VLTCPVCDKQSDIIINLDDPEDIKVNEMVDPLAREFPVQLRHGEARVRLVNGVAQEAFSQDIAKKTAPEINTLVLSKCVVSINGMPVSGQETPVRELSSADRQTLVDFLALPEHQPGAQLSDIQVPCAICGQEYPVSLGVDNLFRF
jgi:hypothetical protein